MNLQNWVELGRQHWKEHLPARYAALKKAGRLDASLQEAANQTYSEVSRLEEAGFQPDEAWQMARETYLLLPPEESEDAPARPMQSLMQEIAQAQHHAAMALADPDYQIPDPT